MADIKINIQVVEGQAKAAMSGLAKSADDASKSVNALNINMKGVSATTIAIGNTIANFATKAISAFGSAVSDLVVGGLQLETQIQSLTNKFQALLPATEDAKKFLEDISKLSDQTPFEFEELADAANKLLIFGVEAKNVESTLKTLGDIATASGANIVELSTAFGKAAEAGVVTGRELNAFRNNGIPVLQELATQLGVTTEQVKKLANDGKISTKDFEQALIGLGKEGGFAFNAMAKAAETLGGSQKRLEDSVEGLQRVFGSALAPVVIMVRNAISQLIERFAQFLKDTDAVQLSTMILVNVFNNLVKVGALLFNAFGGIQFVINELAAGITFIATKPIALFLTGIETMIKGLAEVAGALGLNREALDNAATGINGFKEAIESVPGVFHETAQQVATDMAATSQAADEFTTNVEDSYISLVEGMKSAATGTGAAASEVAKGLTEAQLEEQRKQLENQISHDNAMAEQRAKKDQVLFEQVLIADGELSAQDEMALLRNQDMLNRELENEQLVNAKKLGDKQTTALLSEKIETNRATREVEIRRKENELKKQQDQQSIRDREAFFAVATSLASSENKTLLRIGQAAALAQLAIKTPEAIASSFAFGSSLGGPPLGFAFGAIAAAAMAAQAAQIVGVKFAEGGIVPGNSFSGDQVAARLNSGEMVLNKQQQSNLFEMANQGTGGGDNVIHVSVELDGEVIGRSVSRQVANGLKLGEVV